MKVVIQTIRSELNSIYSSIISSNGYPWFVHHTKNCSINKCVWQIFSNQHCEEKIYN